MNIPDAAIEAAAETLAAHYDSPAICHGIEDCNREAARAAVEAALPAIREALAQEIEALPKIAWNYAHGAAKRDAARIVRSIP